MPEPPDWNRRAEPDELPEWMDEPCSFEEWRECIRDLEQVNQVSRGYRPTLHFLERVSANRQSRKALRILDVGSGGGDALRRIARWATRNGVPVELAGIDLNPFAARAAQQACEADLPIRWLTGDVFSYGEPVDVVISSLLTHHLPTPDVVRFIVWMEMKAELGWFINDLERSSRASRWFGLLARFMRWHRFVQHDGPVSFRRSFRAEDWERMLAQANVPASACRIASWRPGRLCVGRWK